MLFTTDGKPICFKCKQVGHKNPECLHKYKSVEELQKLYPNTVFCTIALLTHTNFLPSEEEIKQPESTGVNLSGSTGVRISDEDGKADLGPTRIRATTSNNAVAFLQTIQDEYISNKSAERASLLFVTINKQDDAADEDGEKDDIMNEDKEDDMANEEHVLTLSQRAVRLKKSRGYNEYGK